MTSPQVLKMKLSCTSCVRVCCWCAFTLGAINAVVVAVAQPQI